MCGNRLIVDEEIDERFAEVFRKEVEKVKVGNGFEEGRWIGGIMKKGGFDKIVREIEDGVDKGGKTL
ncbi:aldehyde dehydrogenase family protein, partial [Bacillus pumilus]|uniref:aldehyde dehydrogenase family protein n=1 Tax=Bacillus pumilus TaxID=1408 RepID=UPI0021B4F6F1